VKTDKTKLPIATRYDPDKQTVWYGFLDKRYYLPVFRDIYIHRGWVYGHDGTMEWTLGQALPGYVLDKQYYGEVIFRKQCDDVMIC